jgi:hypothetical protein
MVQRNYNKPTPNKCINMGATNRKLPRRATQVLALGKALTMHKFPRESTLRVQVLRAKFAISLNEDLTTFLRCLSKLKLRDQSTKTPLTIALTVPLKLGTMNMKAPIVTNHAQPPLLNCSLPTNTSRKPL